MLRIPPPSWSRRLLPTSRNNTLTGIYLAGRRSSSTWSPLQRRLLQAALTHVPEHGWTQDALAAAALSQNLSMATAGLVPNPGAGMVKFCMDEWNERLRQALIEKRNTSWVQTRWIDRIAEAFQLRLSYEKELMQANRWHEAMALGARPDHLWTTTSSLQDLVDLVVTAASDSAEEAEQISALQKMSLGAIYAATELHMLSSLTEHYGDENDTWEFMQQQLEHWERMRLGGSIPLPWLSLPSMPPSTALYVSSSVVSALASGAASLIMPPNKT